MPNARHSLVLRPATAAVAVLSICAAAPAGLVDLEFSPIAQTVEACDLVEIDFLMSTIDEAGQEVGGLDAIIAWDPEVLELLGVDDSGAGALFFVSDFLNDPDGINDDLTDGLALYTALAPPGAPVTAPPQPETLVITTFQFRALKQAPPSVLALVPSFGVHGRTQVLLIGTDVTGDISSTSETTVGTCPGDIDANGEIEFADLLRVLSFWGPCAGCCPEDIDGNGDIGFSDLLIVLSFWGPCP